jgi:excisionase family DNA binding protein
MTGSRRWITVRETAEYLGIAAKSVYEMIAAEKIPAAHVGRLVRIDFLALESDLEAQVQGQPPAAHGKGGRG